MSAEELRAKIREVPDFPKPGILFYDITTLLKDPAAFHESIRLMLEPFKDDKIDVVVGMESRGFIFSAPMAYELGAGLVPVRKLGKLPAETLSVEYALEYGSNTLEIHRDAIQAGQRVLIVDDQDPLAGLDRVAVDLERVRAVLEGILDGQRLGRQLAELADRDEAGTELVGHRSREDEAARLHPDDDVDLVVLERLEHEPDRLVEGRRVLQQGRDVVEQDPRLREVRD